MRLRAAAAALLLPAAVVGQTAAEAPGGPLADVSIEQRLGARLPLAASLRDETGKVVALGDYFGARPVVLALIYYRCPMLCGYVERGTSKALKTLAFSPGEDFELVTVSIDPSDTPALARGQKAEFLRAYGRPSAANGIHFLTGEAGATAAIARAAGFRFTRDRETGEFSHAAGLFVATPDGRLSRYFFGVEYSARDLRLALTEASKGRLGSLADRLLLYCSHYDPKTGRYSVAILRLLRVLGVATVAGLALLIAVVSRRPRRAEILP
jgi:protein SCO1/2